MQELVRQFFEQWEGKSIWAILTTIVAVSVATLFAKWFDARSKHRYDRELEAFKEKLGQDRLVFNTALSSLSTAAAAANPRIVDAIDSLWKAILQIRDVSGDSGFYADLLTKEEWCRSPNDPGIKDRMQANADGANKRAALLKEMECAESSRPFVGERLWAVFFVYRALMLRVSVIVELNFVKGVLPYWYEDSAIQQLMKLLLSEEELQAVEHNKLTRFKSVRSFAESRMLAEMNHIVAGHRSADSGLEHAAKLLRAVAEFEQKTSI